MKITYCIPLLTICSFMAKSDVKSDLPPYLVPHSELEFPYEMSLTAAMFPVPGDDSSKSYAA
jgi:hypothetical protein